VKYKRIEKKVDRIIQLLETIASRLPQEAAIETPAVEASAPPVSVPLEKAPSQETPKAERDPLALLEDREEWRKLIEGWEEPAGFPRPPK
jgi:hypothetical protein